MVLTGSPINATTIVNQTLFATLTTGSLAGTQFLATVSFDASQIPPSGQGFAILNSFDFARLGVAFDRNNDRAGIIGYLDLSNQFGSGSFVFTQEPASGWMFAGFASLAAAVRKRGRGPSSAKR